MKAHAEANLTLKFMIVCSLLGWCILLLMITIPPATVGNCFWQNPFVGSLLFLMCAWGSLVAVSPRRCTATHATQTAETAGALYVKTDGLVSTEGHHPNCGKFSGHTIKFKGTSHCAACTGLFIGAIAAMIMIVPYFFFGLNARPISFPAILIGQLASALGLLQFKFKGWAKMGVNLLFVLGTCLMLIGIDELVHSVFIDVYLMGLILVWILTRIMISQWNHHRICLACGFSCKAERKVDASTSPT